MQALTIEQQRAIALEGRNCCLIAGAGSGKTHTLVNRILRDTNHTRPETMVVVTFTNAAANELRERLARLDLDPASFRHIGTLHGWATKETLKRGETIEIATPKQIKAATDRIKNTLGAMARNMSGAEIWRHAVDPPQFGNGKAVGIAVRNCLRADGLTHHDLILQGFSDAVMMGRVTAPARIYVDEYQDSAPVDAIIYRTLGNQGANLYLIGDPRQAIYGFRGATPQNLATAWSLADDRAILTINHRSMWAICDQASLIAAKMAGLEFGTRMVPATAEEGTYNSRHFTGEHDEIIAARDWITARQRAGLSCAVLTRYNAQASAMGAALRAEGAKVACSADKAPDDPVESVEDSLAKLQTAGEVPTEGSFNSHPAEWWNSQMTSLGIPFANQDALLPRLLACREPGDLMAAGETFDPGDAIAVATIHAAKGLEWDAVWFLGADSQAFRIDDQEAGRMAYVAATRARQHLVISHAGSRLQPESGKSLTGLALTGWVTATPETNA